SPAEADEANTNSPIRATARNNLCEWNIQSSSWVAQEARTHLEQLRQMPRTRANLTVPTHGHDFSNRVPLLQSGAGATPQALNTQMREKHDTAIEKTRKERAGSLPQLALPCWT